ncbi:hypothetical protein JX266_002721 [Neoarthrinium moseri]|nr:hypothetical protein JX266_002721 [Neoarthrinium moseri]
MSRSIAPSSALLRSVFQSQSRQCRRFLSTQPAAPKRPTPSNVWTSAHQQCLRARNQNCEQRRFKSRTVEEAKSRYRTGPFSWKAGILFVLTSAGLVWYFEHEKQRMQRKRIAEATKGVGRPKVGGDFELVDQNGRPFSSEEMKGRYSLVYFGFSHCPDICPEELDKMATMFDIVEKENPGAVLPVFITCDPARDNPEVLKTYLSEFHPSFIGLTGTYDQIKNVCRLFRVYFSTPRDVKPGQDYLVDHSIYFYLMDPEGDFVEALGRQHSPQAGAKLILDHTKDWKAPARQTRYNGPSPQIQYPIHEQSQSRLFALPLELRLIIWRQALLDGADAQHIVLQSNPWQHDAPVFARYACRQTPDKAFLSNHSKDWQWMMRDHEHRDGHLGCGQRAWEQYPPLSSPMGLLLACRRTYVEAVAIVYARICRFDARELMHFLDELPPCTLRNRITELELWVRPGVLCYLEVAALEDSDPGVCWPEQRRDFDSVCRKLAAMGALKWLRISFDELKVPSQEPGSPPPATFFWTDERRVAHKEEGWLHSAALIKGVEDFEVSINDVDEYAEEFLEEWDDGLGGTLRVRRRREPAWVYGWADLLKGGINVLDKVCDKYSRPLQRADRM